MRSDWLKHCNLSVFSSTESSTATHGRRQRQPSMMAAAVLVLLIFFSGPCKPAAQLAAHGAGAATCSCIVNLIGSKDSAGAVGSVSEASIRCVGNEKIQLIVSSDMLPFTEDFTGVTIVQHPTAKPRALVTFPSVDVKIDNSTIRGMTTDLAAILLFANSTVSIQNSIFEHNMAMVSGSIVTNGLPHLSVDNCSFHNNSGKTGGAIFHASTTADCAAATPCTLSISQSIFTSNTAVNSGAVAILADSIIASISRSSFAGNAAERQSGALSIQRNYANSTGTIALQAQGTNFTNNTAGLAGGLYASDADVQLTACKFNGNTAMYLNGGGGGLYTNSIANISVNSCTFSNNTGQQGAAIYLNSTAPTCQRINECAFDISQSNFEDNTGVAGGAIDMTADSLAVHVKDSNFTRNRAQSSYAGGLNLDQPAYLPRNANRCALKVVQSRFVNNSAGLAGALHASAGQVHLHSCLFEGNVANTREAGGIFVDSVSDMLIDSCSFINQTASMGGAVLFNKSAPGCAQTPSCPLNITNSTFAQNTASMAGGAVHILTDSLQVILDNNTFSENSAQYCGGLCLQTTSNSSQLLRIKGNNTRFSGNWAGESAGLRVNASDVQLSGFIFQNNSATSGHGGGLHVQQLLALKLDDCQFLQNSAESGAALHVSSTAWYDALNYTCNISGSSFTNNLARTNAAVNILATSLQVSLKASNFSGNAAQSDFGAIGVRGLTPQSPRNISLQADICSFSNNSANLSGALYTTASLVTLINCQFNGNHAATGAGGAYIDSVVTLQLENSMFTSNIGQKGAAVFVNATILPGMCRGETNCAVLVSSSSFIQNSASQGSALCVASDVLQVNITGSKFHGNTATVKGGAVYMTSATYGVRTNSLAAVDSTFTSNQAAGRGGAVYLEDIGNAYFRNCTMHANSGLTGGGLCVISQCNSPLSGTAAPKDDGLKRPAHAFDCHVELAGIHMTDNHAAMAAGAVYLELDGYETLVVGLDFLANTAGNNTKPATAAMYVGKSGLVFVGQSVSSILYMLDSTFANNTGTDAGTLLLDDLQCIAVSNTSFVGNNGSGAVAIQGTSADPSLCASGIPSSTFGDKVVLQPQLFDPFAPVLADAVSPDNTPFKPYSVDLRHMSVIAGVGVGIWMVDNQQDIAISHSTLQNNTALAAKQSNGAALYMSGTSSLVLKSCNFTGNSAGPGGATLSGGAVYVTALNKFSTNITDCQFHGNTAASGGGAVYIWVGALNIIRSSFGNNQAGPSGGGAVICRDCNSVSLVDSKFDANSCTGLGGALKVTGVYAYMVLLDHIQACNNRAAAGGAISIDTEDPSGRSFVAIINSLFEHNTAQGGPSGNTFDSMHGLGGALRLFVAALWLEDSVLQDNAADAIAGAIFFNQSCLQASSTGVVSQYDFGLSLDARNLAVTDRQQQQAVIAQNRSCSSLILANASIESNTAGGAGGALYLTSPEGLFPLNGSLQLSEQAAVIQQAGSKEQGRMLADGYHNKLGSSNRATHYGNRIAYPAAYIAIGCSPNAQATYGCSDSLNNNRELGSTESVGADVHNFWSTSAVDADTGKPLARLALSVQLQDMMGQVMPADFPSGEVPRFQVNLPAASSSTVFGQLTALANLGNGVASFDGLLVRAPPGFVHFSMSSTLHPDLDSAFVSVSVRSCEAGEVRGPNGDLCDRCPSSQYSFDTSKGTCDSPCPEHADCLGGSGVTPQLGCWASAADSTFMHICPNQDACRGDRPKLQTCQAMILTAGSPSAKLAPQECPAGNGMTTWSASYLDMQCTKGYQGPLCSICQEGYGVSGRFQCDKCQQRLVAGAQYFLILLAAILINMFLIWRLLKEDVAAWDLVEGSDYVEVVVIYIQLASLLGLLNIPWPSVMSGLFKAASWIMQMSPQNGSVSCMLSQHSTAIPGPVALILLQLLLPFAILAALCIAWAMWRQRQTAGSPSDWPLLGRQLELIAYSVLGYYYPSLVQASLSVFSCLTIDHPIPSGLLYQSAAQERWPSGYWIPDMQNKCFDGWHLRLSLYLGLPAVLVLCIGIPVAFAVPLGCRRSQLTTPQCREQRGYAYRMYKLSSWWEHSGFQLKLLVLLLVIVNGKPLGDYLQTLIVLCLLILELLYQVLWHPYRASHIQGLQNATITVVLYSGFASLFLQNYGSVASKGGLGVVGIGMGVINVAFFAFLLLCASRAYLLTYTHKLFSTMSGVSIQLAVLYNRLSP